MFNMKALSVREFIGQSLHYLLVHFRRVLKATVSAGTV